MIFTEHIVYSADALSVFNPAPDRAVAGYALSRWLMGDPLLLIEIYNLPATPVRAIDVHTDDPWGALRTLFDILGVTASIIEQHRKR